ncbi:hypothetical protein GGP41_001796 [Bipolaris sorokiniana]|uniref:Uncharacterized protein n=1 Tax=Cochliobolus sativus TaxID=45130 RepID=A0A8H5ZS73_COCSA|nr:hypothetical protein GGP41_001796 [Bipolaris sorokiniana]
MCDFEIFDKASRQRGTLRCSCRFLVALGVILIVLLLVIDAFFQKIVALPDKWTLHETPGIDADCPRLPLQKRNEGSPVWQWEPKITWPEYETFAVCGCGDNVRDLLDITFAWLNTTIDWRIQGRTA